MEKAIVHLDTMHLFGKKSYEMYQNALRLEMVCDRSTGAVPTDFGYNVRTFQIYDYLSSIRADIFRLKTGLGAGDSDLISNVKSALSALVTDDSKEIDDFISNPQAAFDKYLGYAKVGDHDEYYNLVTINDLVPLALQLQPFMKIMAPILYKLYNGKTVSDNDLEYVLAFGDAIAPVNASLQAKLKMILDNLLIKDAVVGYSLLAVLGSSLSSQSLRSVAALYAWVVQAIIALLTSISIIRAINRDNVTSWATLSQLVKEDLKKLLSGIPLDSLVVYYSSWNVMLYDYFEDDVLKSSTYNWLREKLVGLKFWLMKGSPERSIVDKIEGYIGMNDYNDSVEEFNYIVSTAVLWTPALDEIFKDLDGRLCPVIPTGYTGKTASTIIESGRRIYKDYMAGMKPILYPIEPALYAAAKESYELRLNAIEDIAKKMGLSPALYLMGTYYYQHDQVPPGYEDYKINMTDDRSDTLLSEQFIDLLGDNAGIFATVGLIVLTKKLSKLPKWLKMDNVRKAFWTARILKTGRFAVVSAGSLGVGWAASDTEISSQKLKEIHNEVYQTKTSLMIFNKKPIIAINLFERDDPTNPKLILYTGNEGIADDKKTPLTLSNKVNNGDILYSFDKEWTTRLA